jgi:hypothetical protein
MANFGNVGLLLTLLAVVTSVLKVGKVNNESIQNAEDVVQGRVSCKYKMSVSDMNHESLKFITKM